MTIFIPGWAVPLAFTVLLWAGLALWPMPPRMGDYDFSAPFVAMFRLGAGTVATLFAWLIYFIILSL